MLRNIVIISAIVLLCLFFWTFPEQKTSTSPITLDSVSDQPQPQSGDAPQAPGLTPQSAVRLVNPDQTELEASAVGDDKITPAPGKSPSKSAGGVIVGARSTPVAPGAPTVNSPQLEEDDARTIFSALSERSPPEPDNSNGIISGLPGSAPQTAAVVEPTARATPTREPAGLPWVRGQARGYAMLYAMHPNARAVVEQQVRNLLTSHLRAISIAVLIDGTFTQDFDYLKSVISRLTADGRELTVALYLTNGATMRKWDTTPINVMFTRIEPTDFRRRIMYDQSIRNQFMQVISQARGIFQFNSNSSVLSRNVAIVMLEDNLDWDGYRAMRALAGQQLGDLATFVRNPCVGCYDGNNGDPQGDSREEHRLSYFSSLGQDDAFTLDGVGFQYPDGSGSPSSVSSEQLLQLMEQSMSRGLRYFGLWRHAWQGVTEGVPNVHPDQRFFKASSDEQAQFEIQALRHGLELEPATEAQ